MSLRPLSLATGAVLVLLGTGVLSSVRADTFSFVTSGVFNNIPVASGCSGNATNTITCSDGRVVVFVGSSFSQDYPANNLITTGITFGTFQTQNVPPSTAVGPIFPQGLTLVITVSQLGPEVRNGTLTGTMEIEHAIVADFDVFRFNPNFLVIEGSNYRSTFAVFDFFFPSNDRVPSSTSSINNLPEPTTVVLLGAGLIALGARVRKRRTRILRP